MFNQKLAEALNELAEAVSWQTRTLHGLFEQLRKDQTNILLDAIHKIERKIMASQAELAADLKLVLAQQKKTAEEIKAVQAGVDVLNAKIVDLEEAVAAGGAPSQELTDAVAEVKAQALVVDELIPDVPPPV